MEFNMIKIKDIVQDTYTNASGYVLYLALVNELENSTNVVSLSFEGVSSTSSSFLNSSLGAIIDERSINILKRIKPINVAATQAEILKKYIQSASKLAKN